MSTTPIFPALTNWEPTRQSLHWYSRAVGVVPRAHGKFHEKWWHISLKVLPDGPAVHIRAFNGQLEPGKGDVDRPMARMLMRDQHVPNVSRIKSDALEPGDQGVLEPLGAPGVAGVK